MLKITIFAEEEKPETESEDSTGEELVAAERFQDSIDKVREAGATKKSLNTLTVEWHRLTKQYPIPHLPVTVCMEAFNQTLAEELVKSTKPQLIKEKGRLAYCGSLPKLADRESIRDFIACVVNGMALNIIPGPEGTRLLYGAQVAQAALPAKRKWRKDPAKTKPETAAKCTQTAPKQPSNSAEPAKESAA